MATNYDTASLCRETERKWHLYRWRAIECPTAVEGISPEQRYYMVSAGIHSLRHKVREGQAYLTKMWVKLTWIGECRIAR